MKSGQETSLSISFGSASVVLDNGITQTYTNGQTRSVNTDWSVVYYTSSTMTFSYGADFEEGGATGGDQLSVIYSIDAMTSIGAMTLAATLSEDLSTTTEVGKTVDSVDLRAEISF